MKICRICGEEYQEEHEKCAFCGCPEDWSSKQNWEFPEEIREGYELVKIFDTEAPFPDGLYWSTEKENVVCIHKLPMTEAGNNCLRFMECLSEAEEWHPELYKTVPPEENTVGYYICEYRPGKTLEEITEVISKLSLGQLNAPCILYDLNGYYQTLHQLLQQMIAMGLSTPARQRNIAFAADLAQIRAILEK